MSGKYASFVYAVLFLFFLQLLTDFVGAIYAFGLMGTSIPGEIVFVLLLFSPALLSVFKRTPSQRALLILALLMLSTRLVETLLDTRVRMIVSGLGVALFLIYFPALLHRVGKEGTISPATWGAALTLGTVLAIFFRAIHSGIDISTYGWHQAAAWVLAIPTAAALLRSPETPGGHQQAKSRQPGARFGHTLGQCLGLISVFILLYFAIGAPNVIARWTGANFLLILGVLAAVLLCFSFLLIKKPAFFVNISTLGLLTWNVLFVLAMTLTILAHQTRFPAEESAYPLYEPATGWIALIPLLVMLLLSPVILVNFMRFTQQMIASAASMRAISGGFTLASFFLLLSIFGHVFTTVYDYIPVVGPFFRDKFWLVHLVVGVVMTIPVAAKRKSAVPTLPLQSPRLLAFGIVLASLGAVAGAWASAAKPTPVEQTSRRLRILTYNIQQGYNRAGQLDFTSQLDLMRQVKADIIGLQESDTNRISGSNNDLVRYFADRLEMYSYYGPKTVNGTFGIALLSKYPLQNPRTFYMYSEGEQTATITAQVTVSGRTFNLVVTHLGNGGPLIQQTQLLEEVRGKPDVIAMGDFNFRPDTEQYRLTTQELQDAWLLKWSSGEDDQGMRPDRRIDHVFLSPGMTVTQARYIDSPASDHPALWVEIAWE